MKLRRAQHPQIKHMTVQAWVAAGGARCDFCKHKEHEGRCAGHVTRGSGIEGVIGMRVERCRCIQISDAEVQDLAEKLTARLVKRLADGTSPGVCAQCKKKVSNRYANGKCGMCGL